MAELTKNEVLKLARLARLQLSDDEVAKFQKEITEILTYVEQLQSVDTKDLDPTYQVTGLKNVTRKDETIDYGEIQKDLLKNAPATEDGYIKVKRVLQ